VKSDARAVTTRKEDTNASCRDSPAVISSSLAVGQTNQLSVTAAAAAAAAAA